MGKKTDLAVNRRRKATSGAATAYMSRNQALKKLQLRLADFRRICILKGIYPHEPRHHKKAGGATGSTASKTYYYAKDINFLLHEPIVNKFREYKVNGRLYSNNSKCYTDSLCYKQWDMKGCQPSGFDSESGTSPPHSPLLWHLRHPSWSHLRVRLIWELATLGTMGQCQWMCQVFGCLVSCDCS